MEVHQVRRGGGATRRYWYPYRLEESHKLLK
jgi:hypothetical protein